MYKLLALDLDGTLVGPDGHVRPEDLSALERLRALGIPITIATGRLFSGSVRAAAEAGIEGPIACVDGSHIAVARTGESLFEQAIAGENARLLREVLARHRIANFVFAQDGIVHDALGEPFAAYVRNWSPKVTVVEEALAHPHWEASHGIQAVVAVGPEANVEAAAGELRETLADVTFVLSFTVKRGTGLSAMVVRALGPTKGTAIRWLAEHYGCSTQEVVVVGDWLNDVPMFREAGRSFVMAQAPEHVKETATDRLERDAFEGGGVAEAIRRTWGV